MNHTPKAYIHKNLTLNHTPKPNHNCHIQSIKTNTATKALPNIQSEIRNEKLGHQKVQTLIEIGEDACGSRSADLDHQNIPYSDQRFLHTKIFVEKMRKRERE